MKFAVLLLSVIALVLVLYATETEAGGVEQCRKLSCWICNHPLRTKRDCQDYCNKFSWLDEYIPEGHLKKSLVERCVDICTNLKTKISKFCKHCGNHNDDDDDPSQTTKSSTQAVGTTAASVLTTGQKTTALETTALETTGQETTGQETTAQETTAQETTAQKTTAQDTTAQQTTAEHSTQYVTTIQETTAIQTTGEHTTALKTTAQQTTAEETTALQTTGEQTTGEQTTGEQTTGEQTTGEQTTGEQTTNEQTTGEQTTNEQTTGEQTTDEQTTGEQTTNEQTTDEQTTAEVTTAEQSTQYVTTIQVTTAIHTTAQQTTAEETTALQTTGETSTSQHTTDQDTTAVDTTALQTTAEQTTAVDNSCTTVEDCPPPTSTDRPGCFDGHCVRVDITESFCADTVPTFNAGSPPTPSTATPCETYPDTSVSGCFDCCFNPDPLAQLDGWVFWQTSGDEDTLSRNDARWVFCCFVYDMELITTFEGDGQNWQSLCNKQDHCDDLTFLTSSAMTPWDQYIVTLGLGASSLREYVCEDIFGYNPDLQAFSETYDMAVANKDKKVRIIVSAVVVPVGLVALALVVIWFIRTKKPEKWEKFKDWARSKEDSEISFVDDE